jgi:hypothetical protein
MAAVNRSGCWGTVLFADGDWADRIFDGVVVDWECARIGVAHQRGPAFERMLDGLGGAAAGGHGCLLGQQPGMQLGQHRLGLLLAQLQALRRSDRVAVLQRVGPLRLAAFTPVRNAPPQPFRRAVDLLPVQGDLLMPGKPRRTSFPEETFIVKDRFGLDSKREGLNRASGSYRHFYRQPVPLAGDSHR